MQPTNERVLFVVDDGEDCAPLISILTNFDATTATTIEEALALARSERFDLYLIKKVLPNGTGAHLCLRIREFDPHTPILFLTDFVVNEWREAERVGAQGFFIRKGSPSGLADTVSQVMKSQVDNGDSTVLM